MADAPLSRSSHPGRRRRRRHVQHGAEETAEAESLLGGVADAWGEGDDAYQDEPEDCSSSSSSPASTTVTPRSTFIMADSDNPRALEEGHRPRRPTAATVSSSSSSTAPLPMVATTTSATSSGSQLRSIASAVNSDRKGPALVEVTVNPHVGDPYFVGTIYKDESNGSQTVHSEKGEGVYLRHVKNLSRQWPRLRYLAEFMEAGTVPKKSAALDLNDVMQRRARVKVALVDFTDPHDIKQETFTTGEALARGLKNSFALTDTATKRNRLFVAEDLSSTSIEVLGAGLDMDPTFFRGHLEDHTWFNIKDDWVEMPELESQSQGRDFVTLAYMKPRFFEDESVSDRARDHAGEWNVLRRIDFEGQVKSGKNAWWEDSPHEVGLLRSKVSIWSRQDDDGWTGVILVDPHVDAGHPLWNGYGRLSSPPGLDDPEPDSRHLADMGLFEGLTSTIGGLSAQDRDRLAADPEHVTSHVYPFIFAEVLVTLEYSFTGLFQIEWLLDSARTRKLDGLESCIDSLHKWQRRLPFYVEYIQDGITALEGRYHHALSDKGRGAGGAGAGAGAAAAAVAASGCWQAGVRRDLGSLLARLQVLQLRADKIMQMAVAIISIEETKRAMLESRNMGRITYLAFVFVPMSFVTSFLSMNEELSQRSAIVYCVFFAVAVPLSLVAVLLALYWNRIMQWWEAREEGKKKQKRKKQQLQDVKKV
ncbi:hypothetical protein JDV02_008190 [Purpureocillium takamizusanense]|uniref:Uncharacterized protein n=1 Tax=Purpureocillium takamizusanense TaxID=2060973 RepID=A0A9Q8QP84_9HYPO|nr:uncharacterized protein JDV02_008190 [Purpureocillium takamizusanense]UNI22289.1 hypothetical protein JDV02_008190 [Purpureocillium takamizusanense]